MPEPRIVTLRIPPGLLHLIEQDIQKNEEYITRTDWIIDAIHRHVELRLQSGAIHRDSNGGGQ